jgi:hypothetical protein
MSDAKTPAPAGSGLSKTAILVALCAVVLVSIGGAVISPTNAINIFGFGSISALALIAMLKTETVADKIVARDARTDAHNDHVNDTLDNHTGELATIKNDVNNNTKQMLDQITSLQDEVARLNKEKQAAPQTKAESGVIPMSDVTGIMVEHAPDETHVPDPRPPLGGR